MLLELRLKHVEDATGPDSIAFYLFLKTPCHQHLNSALLPDPSTDFSSPKRFCFPKEDRVNTELFLGGLNDINVVFQALISLISTCTPFTSPLAQLSADQPHLSTTPQGDDSPDRKGVAEEPLLTVAAAKGDEFQTEECLHTPTTVQVSEGSMSSSITTPLLPFPCQITAYPAFPMATYSGIWTQRVLGSLLLLFQHDF